MKNSPKELPRASEPSSRQGCAEILGDPYLRQVPSPWITDYREPSLGAEPLPRTPKYCVANIAWSKLILSIQPNRKLILSDVSQQTSDISLARLKRRIRVL